VKQKDTTQRNNEAREQDGLHEERLSDDGRRDIRHVQRLALGLFVPTNGGEKVYKVQHAHAAHPGADETRRLVVPADPAHRRQSGCHEEYVLGKQEDEVYFEYDRDTHLWKELKSN
jgi:hypothetical protein